MNHSFTAYPQVDSQKDLNMKREWNLPLLAMLGVVAWSGSGAFSQSEYSNYAKQRPLQHGIRPRPKSPQAANFY